MPFVPDSPAATPVARGRFVPDATPRAAAAPATPAAAAAPKGSFYDRGSQFNKDMVRTAAAGIRDLGQGAAQLMLLPADAATGLYNIATGGNVPHPSETLDRQLDGAGVPKTQSPLIRGVNQALGGAAIPIGPAATGVRAVAQSGAKETFSGVMSASRLTPAQRAGDRALREAAGDKGIRATLSEALRNAKRNVPGSRPTAAEAVSGLPEGSPLQSVQEVVSKVGGNKAGNASVRFGQREAANTAARDAEAARLGKEFGEGKARIFANANRLSDRLRNLSSFVDDRFASKASALQDQGRFGTLSAQQARRGGTKFSGAETRLADEAQTFRKVRQEAVAGDAADAAGDAGWIADQRQLEMAGADLEKGLLEGSGLKPLGPDGVARAGAEMMSKPNVYASQIAPKILSGIADDVMRITKPDGSIDAEALYTVRAELTQKIKAQFAKDGWDLKDATIVRTTRAMQRAMDDAIEQAGGSGWKQALEKYSSGIGKVEDDALRSADKYKPANPTSVPLANMIDEQTTRQIKGALLNPKVAIANAALRARGQRVGPKVMDSISRRLQNPDDLAFALDDNSVQTAVQGLKDALIKNATRGSKGAVATSGSSSKEKK